MVLFFWGQRLASSGHTPNGSLPNPLGTILQYKAVGSLALKILETVGATLAMDTSANGNGVATSNDVVNGTINVPPVVHDLAHATTVSACPLRLLH